MKIAHSGNQECASPDKKMRRKIGIKEMFLTQESLKLVLSYDEKTGLFTRIKSIGGKNRAGEVAGTVSSDGYIQIHVRGQILFAHRLAWLYVYGSFPHGILDHIDENKINNKICNLRLATNSENMQNVSALRSDNQFGMTGVSRNRRGPPFRSRIKINGKEIHIGSFHTAKDAHDAYMLAKEKIHPFSLKSSEAIIATVPK